ncbi:MAG: ATP-binding protein [candidate division Zixibacteria bacterium]|nr:ATP-binding protein [candidate division Zixibacteria bacterium]
MKKNQIYREEKTKQMLWFLAIRLAIFLFLLVIVIFLLGAPEHLLFPFIIYSLCTLFCLSIILFEKRVSSEGLFKSVAGIQVILEALIEGGIIYATRELNSPFAILFVLTIASSSLLYELVGSLLIATVVSLIYAVTLLVTAGVEFSFLLNPKNLVVLYQRVTDAFFYRTFLYICTFYLVAFISGYLTQKLRAKGKELISASEKLSQIKTDTDDILQHMRSGLVTIDSAGRIIYFNKTAEDILGFSSAEIRGRDYLEVFVKSVPEFADKLTQILKSRRAELRSEIWIASRNGKKIPLGISTSILGDKDTGGRGVIAVFQDISEAKKLEERVRIADRLAAVGELSAGIAHEIRNPLASISGSVEVLKDELSLDGENLKLMELIVKETARLNHILTEFLQYAKIKQTPLRKVEINHLIDEIIEVVKKHPSYVPGINLEKEMDEGPIYILGDENQIKQLLLNLIVNALESMEEEKGEVIIANRSLDQIEGYYFEGEEDLDNLGWVPLAVIDRGKGMTQEQLEKVFQPFYSTKKNGTGLGLAIVQRLVNNLNGRIEFKSQLGIGSVFVVYFQKYETHKEELQVTF